jgi:hypothetical protein
MEDCFIILVSDHDRYSIYFRYKTYQTLVVKLVTKQSPTWACQIINVTFGKLSNGDFQ